MVLFPNLSSPLVPHLVSIVKWTTASTSLSFSTISAFLSQFSFFFSHFFLFFCCFFYSASLKKRENPEAEAYMMGKLCFHWDFIKSTKTNTPLVCHVKVQSSWLCILLLFAWCIWYYCQVAVGVHICESFFFYLYIKPVNKSYSASHIKMHYMYAWGLINSVEWISSSFIICKSIFTCLQTSSSLPLLMRCCISWPTAATDRFCYSVKLLAGLQACMRVICP